MIWEILAQQVSTWERLVDSCGNRFKIDVDFKLIRRRLRDNLFKPNPGGLVMVLRGPTAWAELMFYRSCLEKIGWTWSKKILMEKLDVKWWMQSDSTGNWHFELQQINFNTNVEQWAGEEDRATVSVSSVRRDARLPGAGILAAPLLFEGLDKLDWIWQSNFPAVAGYTCAIMLLKGEGIKTKVDDGALYLYWNESRKFIGCQKPDCVAPNWCVPSFSKRVLQLT